MSVPISAITSWGAGDPRAVHRVKLLDLAPVGLGQDLDPGGELADLGGEGAGGGQHHRQDGHVLFGEKGAAGGLFQPGDLAAHGAAGQLGQHLGIAFPGDDGLQHGPAGHAVDAEITLDSFR
jgi:hypothetical protein